MSAGRGQASIVCGGPSCGVCLATDGSTPFQQLFERLGVIEKETVPYHPGVVFLEGFPSLADRRQHQLAVYGRLAVDWRSIGGFLRKEHRLMCSDGACQPAVGNRAIRQANVVKADDVVPMARKAIAPETLQQAKIWIAVAFS